tara:strand:+ start:208 stop:477 length:270 start_codon:yes stop_codon:yes gene_type:complete
MLQSIRDKEEGIARSPVTPIAQGVTAYGQDRNTRRQAEAVLATVSVIYDTPAVQTTDQAGNIKTPADHPEDFRVRRLLGKTVVQIPMIL